MPDSQVISDKHFCINVCDDINTICLPLFNNFDISYVGFSRTYSDGSTSMLAPVPGLAQNIFDMEMPASGATGHFIKKGIYLQADIAGGLLPEKNITIAREHINIDHAALMFREGDGYTDLFYFASQPDNPQVYSFYLNNLDILEQFSLHFYDKANTLIHQAEKHKIIVPKLKQTSFKSSMFDQQARQRFLKEITPKKFLFSLGETIVKLTKQEVMTLHFISQGKSCKEAAAALQLSPRTVESYLNNVKHKLNCHTKSQAIELFLHSHLAQRIAALMQVEQL